MTAEDRDKLLLSDTQVPDLFITQYMSSLTGSSIQIYLFMLMNRSSSQGKMNVEKISKKLGMAQSEVEEQLFYLTSAGLLEKAEDGSLFLTDIKAREVDRYIESRKDEGLEMPPQHREKGLETVSRSISDTFFMGRMSYSWQRFIDDCASVYKMDPDVIYSLFNELQERGKLMSKNSRPAEELRAVWSKRGVHTSSELEKVLSDDRKVKECMNAMGKKKRKALDGVDIEYINTWILTYKMEPDVPSFLYSYLRKEKNKENVTFPQMDEILQEWFSHNIHDVDAARDYEMKKLAADRTSSMTAFCGELFRKKLDGMDLAIIDKWANTDCWEEPIVRYAYEVLHKFMSTITLSQVDERLQLWKENGVASVTKAKQFEAELKKKNKEAYQERKTVAASGFGNNVAYMENEYTKDHLDKKEQDSMNLLDELLKDN
ncbi:MAG: DnaD domain protein [Clostridiales bacterium]|nr:DnaD domain protein [Clostridiales bacterium]